MHELKEVADFALSKIGCGYVYGATGWKCSLSRRLQQAKQYPSQEANILGVCAKWDGKICYDCAQLTRAAAKVVGVSLPSGATSQWNSGFWQEKGDISTLPDEPGIILYREASKKMQHTEVYVGNGFSCGARNSSLGVNKFPMDGYKWTHWGRLLIPDDIPEPDVKSMTVVAEKGSTVNMRKGPDKSMKVLIKVPLGSVVTVHGTAVSGWYKISFEGKDGYMMEEFLR